MATAAQIAANQANSKLSTGPASAPGKARSSRNSFKHGLYSKELVLPHEDPAELDQLRASLRAEHQPVNTTEEILVNDLAENFWRLRRMREREAFAMQPENFAAWVELGMLAVVQRTMASAERGFHRALAALRHAKKEPGLVPQQSPEPAADSNESAGEIGFVPQVSPLEAELEAATRTELRPFLDQSGSLTREGFQKFVAHIKERCMAQPKHPSQAV